ncbi:MAG: sigma-70 family RNA polymerase sigma factor [Anaerolineae bacterium]|nr:sigma-70 family RNA polymerase sigma factor [Anaerolineae bacterium]
MDEIALIQDAQRGSVEAFNTLILHYQTHAFNLAYRLIGESDAAADATQEAFIAAYNHLAQFRGGSFKSWLMRIVTNTCYDEMRRRKRRPALSLDDDADHAELQLVSHTDNPETLTAQNALNRAIQDCLDGLPDDQRLVTVLCDVQGYDYQEIAMIARVSLGTVKSRISRARQRLRDCLQGAGELLPSAYRLNQRDG